ncbi:PREDICTED: uncharacterized protein LOC104588063 [Nelumbo nucifera]|uniref:Uncharacterized protein LOC104588063 n=2 Tax=Nelumbo nucifera TaxID=4432 RepID=A0A1U7YXF6_NELNU|nr:PREDICTED: uncharacterized protein LOC104588063 [Nelumbo nucifera]DAD24966.1 TPA_asm: hypothetical protein HUJ06_026430 [Nelumbo nucifera]
MGNLTSRIPSSSSFKFLIFNLNRFSGGHTSVNFQGKSPASDHPVEIPPHSTPTPALIIPSNSSSSPSTLWRTQMVISPILVAGLLTLHHNRVEGNLFTSNPELFNTLSASASFAFMGTVVGVSVRRFHTRVSNFALVCAHTSLVVSFFLLTGVFLARNPRAILLGNWPSTMKQVMAREVKMM